MTISKEIIKMEGDILKNIGNVVLLVFGICLVIFSKRIASYTSEYWYKVTKNRYSEKGYQIGFLFVGIIFTILSILAIFQIIEFN
jgi:hypothetical protein